MTIIGTNLEPKYFCTHFNINYLAHALLLHESLTKYNPEAIVFFFCMDDESHRILSEKKLPNVKLIAYAQLENAFPELAVIRPQRNLAEFFYTSTPAICNYILTLHPEVEQITYLDADIYFYSSCNPLFVELDKASVGIIEHRFSRLNQQLLVYGRFNVGWITFKNNETGTNCAAGWLNDCISWCSDKIEDGKYADQKYLDKWPELYDGVKILQHKGANVATWNVRQYDVTEKEGKLYIDDVPLIFYHFSRLKQIRENVFKAYSIYYYVSIDALLKSKIYDPYATSLISRGLKGIASHPEEHYKFTRQPLKFIRHRILEYLFKDVFTVTTIKRYASIALVFCIQAL